MVTSSITAPSEPPPAPRLIARWMTSFETDCLRAASTATSSRGLCAGSGMPDFAATVISRTSLVVMEARLLAVISFLDPLASHGVCLCFPRHAIRAYRTRW